MARFYECSKCEHRQLVGVIDNGLPSGYADPGAVCEKCGAVGHFHFGPGAAVRQRSQIANAVRVAGPVMPDELTDLLSRAEDDTVPYRKDHP